MGDKKLSIEDLKSLHIAAKAVFPRFEVSEAVFLEGLSETNVEVTEPAAMDVYLATACASGDCQAIVASEKFCVGSIGAICGGRGRAQLLKNTRDSWRAGASRAWSVL